MKVFVAGATGAIGRPLVRQLIEAGHEVHAITRSEARAARLQELGIDAHVGDALDAGLVRRIVESARPEVMVHQLTTFPTTMNPFRSLPAARQTARLRIDGTRLFMDVARRYDVRRVIAQSIAFMYKPIAEPRLVTEKDPHYGRGARMMDRLMSHLVRVEDMVTGDPEVEGVALRYGGWYGPGTHFEPGELMHRLAMNRRLPRFKGQTKPWNSIHVEDAASATLAALSGPAGIYNVVDDEPVPWNEFVTTYCTAVGAPSPRDLPSWTTALLGFYMRHIVWDQMPVSNEKAKRELGWQPTFPAFKDGATRALRGDWRR